MIFDKYSEIIFATSKEVDGNMSFVTGDSQEALENRKRFLKSKKITLDSIIAMWVQHGIEIVKVERDDLKKGAYTSDNSFKVDGLITNEPGVYLFLLIADCHQIGIYDPHHKAVGLVHAGWQGLDKETIRNAIDAMKNNFDSQPQDLIVQFGPSLGPCCYKKLPDLKQEHNPKWQPYISRDPDGTFGIDIWRFAEDQLKDAGMLEKNIDNPKVCTYHSEEYFSHRKVQFEGLKEDFRFATVIGIKS